MGISGGVDSVVLLHLLAQKYNVHAIHINHNLQTNSKSAETICQQLCDKLGIKLTCINLQGLDAINNNKENSYRVARYRAFTDAVPVNSTIALAHHKNDQLETRLKRIMTASNDFSGIKCQNIISRINYIRPLINIEKSAIIQYAENNNLAWIEDPSNNDIKFERNNIRHNIIPTLRSLWPGIESAIETLALKNNINNKLSNEIAATDFKIITKQNIIDLQEFNKLSQTRQINCWTYILNQLGLTYNLRQAIDLLGKCQINSCVISATIKWIKHKQQGYFIHNFDSFKPAEQEFTNPMALTLGQLIIEPVGKVRPPKADETVTIRYRQNGQSIQIHNRKHSSKIKKLMQMWNIPSWQRDIWPLVYYNEQLACVPNFAINESFYSDDGINFKLLLADKALVLQE